MGGKYLLYFTLLLQSLGMVWLGCELLVVLLGLVEGQLVTFVKLDQVVEEVEEVEEAEVEEIQEMQEMQEMEEMKEM